VSHFLFLFLVCYCCGLLFSQSFAVLNQKMYKVAVVPIDSLKLTNLFVMAEGLSRKKG